MPKSILKPVGKNCVNRPEDVKTVQELINKVPKSEGGPDPLETQGMEAPLVVDGFCGPYTQHAINRFQIKQFGYGKTDGVVDPGQRTMERLNHFEALATPPPAQPPPPPVERSTQFILQPSMAGDRMGVMRQDRLFLVTQVPRQQLAVYFLGDGTPPSPIPDKFEGKAALLKVKQPRAVNELAALSMYRGQGTAEGADTTLMLFYPEGHTTVRLHTHMVEPGNPKSMTAFGSEFQLVKVLRA